jgi:hypothetical protein
MSYFLVRRIVLPLALVAFTTLPAGADDSPNRSDKIPPTIDVGDLWRLARHKEAPSEQGDPSGTERFFVAAPSIGSKPSTGISGGLSGNVAFYAGDAQTTRISSMAGGFKFTQKGQALAGVKLAVFTDDDRWFLQGDNRLQWTSASVYGLGPGTLPADAENLKYDFFRVYETAYHRVLPGVLFGVGLNVNVHNNVGPGTSSAASFDQSSYVTYSERHGFGLDSQTSSGTSVGLLVDTRDNPINADQGWLANAVYRTFFDGFLGGDSSWQELNLDLRTYHRLTRDGRHKLAFWFLGDMVTGGTAPYLDLPETAGDAYGRSGRGYSEGRYRGERLLYGEVEYRGTVTRNGLFGVVAFLNGTTVDSTETGDKLFQSVAPGAGFGLRVLLNKRSRTNLCADYGWGVQGSRGFYLSIQEAF